MKKNKEKGITLIALIVSIIVIIILTTVTIKVTIESGIIGNAKKAKKEYEKAEEKEIIQLALDEWNIRKYYKNGEETFKKFITDRITQIIENENSVTGADNGPLTIITKRGNAYIVTQDDISDKETVTEKDISDEEKDISKLEPGLYDSNNKQIAKWEDLKINLSKKYSNDSQYKESSETLYSVLNSEKYKNCTDLKIVIPETVTRIEQFAFKDCDKLTSITIPNSVTYIGWYAFDGCRKLTSIEIPEGVTSIENAAFRDCNSLENITIPKSVKKIDHYAFMNCKSLTSVEIPEDVTQIGSSAFHGCSNLKNITIPESVTSIEMGTFENCYNLENVTIPDGITKIGVSAFAGCSKLTNIAIPESVTQIDADAFRGCSHLTDIIIPEGITKIGNQTFAECYRLMNVYIPESVTSIASDAFRSHNGLLLRVKAGSYAHEYAEKNKIVYIMEGTADNIDDIGTEYSIPKEATYDISENESSNVTATWDSETNTLTISGTGKMKNGYYKWSKYKRCIKKCIIKHGVTNIEDYAFFSCDGLEEITISNSVIIIGREAFCCCFSLGKITIPNSVTNIESSAFAMWGSNSIDIVIPNSVTSIGNSAFSNVSHITYYGTATGSPWGAHSMN